MHFYITLSILLVPRLFQNKPLIRNDFLTAILSFNLGWTINFNLIFKSYKNVLLKLEWTKLKTYLSVKWIIAFLLNYSESIFLNESIVN